MRARKLGFVTISCVLLAVVGCGNPNGGGGGGALFCGVGGACPVGYACSASQICVPSLSDAASGDTAAKGDTTSTGNDAAAKDSQIDSVGPDTVEPDIVFPDTGFPDIATADITAPDVVSSGQTVMSIEESDSSVNCTTLDSAVNIASNVTLEPVVVTSPPTALKGSGSTYFTTFFVESQNATADGSWVGLQVIVTADPFSVNIGDVLQITGTIEEFYCMTEISAAAADVVVTGNVSAPAPHSVLVSDFASNATAEPFEGDLVQLSVVQVGDPNPVATDGNTHGECTINHNGGATTVLFAPALGSAYLGTSSTGATTTFTAGQAFASITGNLEWSFGQWLIRARSDADIVLK